MRIEELRSVLTEQADGIEPLDPARRVASVRSRVVRARRRRAATVAAGAVVALVAVVGVVPMLDRDQKPDPVDGNRPDRLAGLAVPNERVAAGFTYRYVEGVESEPGEPVLSHVVSGGDAPQLVMWTSSHRDAAPSLRLREVRAGETERSVSAGFTRHTLLHGKGAHPLRLSQPGAPADTVLALAVYEMVDTPPAGVSDGSTTFRQQVLERELVDARIGARGDTDVSVSVTAPEGHVLVSHVCSTTLGQDVSADLTVNGRPYLGFGCAEEAERDPGADGDRLDVPWVRPGGPLEVRLRLVDNDTEEPVEDPGALLGVAVYADATRTVPLAGWDAPVAVEYEGQQWVHDGYTYQSRPGSRSMGVDGPSRNAPVLVAVALSGRRGAPVTMETYLGGELQDDTRLGIGTGVFGTRFVVQPGTPLDVEVRVSRTVPGLQMGVLYYELAG